MIDKWDEYIESVILSLGRLYGKRKDSFFKCMEREERSITEIMKSYHDGSEKKVMALLADTAGLRQLKNINSFSCTINDSDAEVIETLCISPDIIYNFAKNPV